MFLVSQKAALTLNASLALGAATHVRAVGSVPRQPPACAIQRSGDHPRQQGQLGRMRIGVNFWSYGKAVSQHVPGSYDQSTGFSFTGLELRKFPHRIFFLQRAPEEAILSSQQPKGTDCRAAPKHRDTPATDLPGLGGLSPDPSTPLAGAGGRDSPAEGAPGASPGPGSAGGAAARSVPAAAPEKRRSYRSFSAKQVFLRAPEYAATVYPLTTRWHLVFGNHVPF